MITDPPAQVPPIDFIYYATGMKADIADLPCARSMREEFPIPECAGLPCLTDDLKWREGVPMFVTGRLAGLRLGPASGNLIGARIGAERVVGSIRGLLGASDGGDDDGELTYGLGDDRNRFDMLSISEG